MLTNNVGFHETAMNQLGSNRSSDTFSFQSLTPRTEFEKLIDEFFAKSFTEKTPRNFNLTLTITDLLIKAELFDALLYPSIANNAYADNLAIKANYADKHLEYINVQYGIVTEVNQEEEFYNIDFTDFANSVNEMNELEWKGRRGEWNSRHPLDSLTVTCFCEGFWNAVDAEGNPREMD